MCFEAWKQLCNVILGGHYPSRADLLLSGAVCTIYLLSVYVVRWNCIQAVQGIRGLREACNGCPTWSCTHYHNATTMQRRF